MDFLRELYLGNICPADNSFVNSEEYRRAQNDFIAQCDEFDKNLSKDMKAKFESILETHTCISSMEEEKAFKHGFRCGAYMIYSCFFGDIIPTQMQLDE